jgi:hypothetical protein
MNEPQPAPSPTASAGWYADPAQVSIQRYWDGSAWTDHTAPAPAAQEGSGLAKRRRSQGQRLAIIAAGWLLGWLVVGTILGGVTQVLLFHAGATDEASFYATGIAIVFGIAIGAFAGHKIAGPKRRP